MAMGGTIVSEEEQSRQEKRRMLPGHTSWRFAYEALTHVHSLRLFLMNKEMLVSLSGASLRAYPLPTSPFSSSPVVVCEWRNPGGNSHNVYVPMPFCLIDHSTPFSATVAVDHIEVKLKLLPFGDSFLDGLSFLSFSHGGVPTSTNGGGETKFQKRDEAPFSLARDAELLSADRNLSFYCRNCSAMLTRKPLSHVQELPSTEWRELADHWFGTCCCTNGAKTQLRLAQFEQGLASRKGVCLVGSTICTVHCNDLDNGTEKKEEHSSVEDNGANESNTEVVEDFSERATESSNDTSESGLTTLDGDEGDGAVESPEEDNVKIAIEKEIRVRVTELVHHSDFSQTPNKASNAGAEESINHVHMGTCCGVHHGEAQTGGHVGVQKSSEHAAHPKIPGSGFMSGPHSVSNDLSWKPFNCRACSSLVGVSCVGQEGVQLFKCHISTDTSPGGASDVFRYHTVERVFCNELLANVEENSSYRYIIRGLNSKKILLQIVLVNHESWNCSGSCLGELSALSDQASVPPEKGNDDKSSISCPEATLMIGVGKEEFPPAFLEPVMKIMFCDTSAFSLKEISAVEDWARKQQADDIYMLESEAKGLVDSLQVNRRLFPESYAPFQQFHVSFLAR